VESVTSLTPLLVASYCVVSAVARRSASVSLLSLPKAQVSCSSMSRPLDSIHRRRSMYVRLFQLHLHYCVLHVRVACR